MQKIKQKANIYANLNRKMKLATGHSVKIGKSYNKITVLLSSDPIQTPLTALAYIKNRLILADDDRKYFVFLAGDITAHRDTIYAESVLTSIKFSKPITNETTLEELRKKYHFIPPNLLLQSIQAVQCL